MQKIHVFGQGVARGHIASQTVTTTPVSVKLIKDSGICYAGVEALTIKTDEDIYYAHDDETIETSGAGVLAGAVLSAGTTTINWDSAKIKLQAVSDDASVEILAIHYDNLMKG